MAQSDDYRKAAMDCLICSHKLSLDEASGIINKVLSEGYVPLEGGSVVTNISFQPSRDSLEKDIEHQLNQHSIVLLDSEKKKILDSYFAK